MSKDRQDEIAKQDDPVPSDAKKTEDASYAAKRSEKEEQELEEGLEESMSGSDAPASTRRSREGR